MNGAGGVAGPVSAEAVPRGGSEASTSQKVDGQHVQFLSVSVGPADASFLEEASIFISTTKTKTRKGDKKEKDLKKQLEKILKTVPDMPSTDKTTHLLKQLQESKKNGELNDDQIKRFTQEYSGDSSHQYLALEALIEHLQASEGDHQELIDQLEEYNTRFYEENKKDIQSGINVSVEAAAFAEESSFTTQELRDSWREGLDVPDFTSPIEAYRHVKEKFGIDDVDAGIDWLRKALSTELTAMTKSVDTTHLTHVRRRLEVIFSLNTTIKSSQELERAVIRLLISGAE